MESEGGSQSIGPLGYDLDPLAFGDPCVGVHLLLDLGKSFCRFFPAFVGPSAHSIEFSDLSEDLSPLEAFLF